MATPVATYSFLPWLRQGIANNIKQSDKDTSVLVRANIPVTLNINGKKPDDTDILEEVTQSIELYGPGDIIGIDSRSIVKTEPRNWITNFEPNYLPYIEFYDEDFPWRYTPAKADGHSLRPWLTLVVLKEDEFEEIKSGNHNILPQFKLQKASIEVFPDADTLAYWVHVHVNKDLSNEAAPTAYNLDAVITETENLIQNNPDSAYSRIICPRKLEPNVGYNAFLIPTFESGRLSGLGIDIPATTVATQSAWDGAQDIFPYYHRWYFRTGTAGDFEYLVNMLKPKAADKKVGVRDLDVLHPGSNLPPIDHPVDLNGVLKLGGALKVPYDTLKPEDKAEVDKYDRWDESPYPHAFETAIANRVNLADDYADETKTIEQVNESAEVWIETDPDNPDNNVTDPDPVITSTLYGRWHALVQRLLKEKNGSDMPSTINNNWVHELNLDPRFRASAGFGTKVIQKNQEEYMNAAWEQVGKIVEANNKILFLQFALEVSFFFHQKHIAPLTTEKVLLLTSPIQKRVVANGATIFKQVKESTVPHVVTTPAFRAATRPHSRLVKNLRFTDSIKPSNLLSRISSGAVKVVEPKKLPEGAISLSKSAEVVAGKGMPPFVKKLLQGSSIFQYLPLLLLLIIILLFLFITSVAGISILSVIGAVMVAAFFQLKKWKKQVSAGSSIKEEAQTTKAVEQLPKSPDFKITTPAENYNPSYGTSDSVEAIKFKSSLKDAYTFVQVKFPEPVLKPLKIAKVSSQMVQLIHPEITIKKQVAGLIKIPPHLKGGMATEEFTPVMAYPEFDVPMYKPLSDMSVELFLPNINLIEQNSITLLETNQKFIESYMVGLNHEMARELLWREYPTDQRGSYFRQFWDVTNFLPANPVPDNIREKLRDIPPIHKWSKTSSLGTHNQREEGGDNAQIVLVVRGELLKKYPTAVIYAHKADWWRDEHGVANISKERVLMPLTTAEESNPPRTKLKTPLFEAKVDPDIYFFGFDLTSVEAKGGKIATDDAGWFFVIKERPGEPRFGLDTGLEEPEPKLLNWNNLSWKKVGTNDGEHITIANINLETGTDLNYEENKPNPEDVQANWSPAASSADIAYILYQVPVLVAVHGSRMLPKK
jgi:hypothetical protein